MTFNEILEQISKKMDMGRPRTERLLDLNNPPCNVVLKREFSDTANDVLLPGLGKSVDAQTKRARAFLRKRMQNDPNADCAWLIQEYVPCLAFGEFRFVCVGAVPMRDIVTGLQGAIRLSRFNEMWAYECNDSLRTLAGLQCVRLDSPH